MLRRSKSFTRCHVAFFHDGPLREELGLGCTSFSLFITSVEKGKQTCHAFGLLILIFVSLVKWILLVSNALHPDLSELDLSHFGLSSL